MRPAEHELDTEAGPVPYDVLVLATGAEPIRLPGAEGVPGVHLLRTLDDAARLRPVLARQHDIVVVGAGWIGAEFATAAREAGCAVTVVEAADRPLAGALPAEVAAPMAAWYAEQRRRAAHPRARGRASSPARCVLDGRPRAARRRGRRRHRRPPGHGLAGRLRHRAGRRRRGHRRRPPAHLRCRTCTRSATAPPSRPGGTARRLLVHHWDNALQGPRTVAANIIGGEPPRSTTRSRTSGPSSSAASCSTPATTASADTTAVARRPGRRRLVGAAGCGRARLVALLAVGRPRDLAQGRRLIEAGTRMDPRRWRTRRGP